MVCQNESIDDSEAPLAHDLRVLVRERLKAGDSDAQVIDFLVARYGEFVLLKPRLSWHTAALWGLPPAVLFIGIVTILVVVRRRGSDGIAGTGESRRPPKKPGWPSCCAAAPPSRIGKPSSASDGSCRDRRGSRHNYLILLAI